MSARRKTLLANEIQNFEADLNDDEAEKRQRIAGKLLIDLINSLKLIFFEYLERAENPNSSVRNRRRTIVSDELAAINKTLVNGGGNTPQLAKPSNEQLSCLYNNCVKLLNENVNFFNLY